MGGGGRAEGGERRRKKKKGRRKDEKTRRREEKKEKKKKQQSTTRYCSVLFGFCFGLNHSIWNLIFLDFRGADQSLHPVKMEQSNITPPPQCRWDGKDKELK